MNIEVILVNPILQNVKLLPTKQVDQSNEHFQDIAVHHSNDGVEHKDMTGAKEQCVVNKCYLNGLPNEPTECQCL